MKTSRFNTLAYSLGLVAALNLGFGSGPTAADSGVVRVGGVGNYGPVLPLIAGQKLGLFKKLGVKMEFTNYRGGAAAMEGMAAGEADMINFFPPGLALATKRGVKATIVSAGTLTPRGWHIMVKADSPINTVKDLAGKQIGVTANGSTTDFFARWTAKQSGGDMTRVPLGGAGLVPNLLSGNVDAIVAYPPLSYKIGISGDGKTVVDLGKAMSTNLPDVWVATDEIIAKNPEGVDKVLIGLFSAIRYMKENREWAIDFIHNKTGLPVEVATKEYEQTILGLSDDGNLKAEWVDASLRLGKLAGLTVPPANEMFTSQFVPVKTITP
jgi:NitT/TauT family transport system substrate-binding protein